MITTLAIFGSFCFGFLFSLAVFCIIGYVYSSCIKKTEEITNGQWAEDVRENCKGILNEQQVEETITYWSKFWNKVIEELGSDPDTTSNDSRRGYHQALTDLKNKLHE
jgi:hypothetical protein